MTPPKATKVNTLTITSAPHPTTAAVQSRCRHVSLTVIRDWAADRGVDVKELLFRMRTASFQRGA